MSKERVEFEYGFSEFACRLNALPPADSPAYKKLAPTDSRLRPDQVSNFNSADVTHLYVLRYAHTGSWTLTHTPCIQLVSTIAQPPQRLHEECSPGADEKKLQLEQAQRDRRHAMEAEGVLWCLGMKTLSVQ